MGLEQPSPSRKEKRRLEDQTLKVGYLSMLQERWPFNEDITQCSTKESAYFLHLEKEYLQVPENLEWKNLKSSIPKSERSRIGSMWETVNIAQKNLNQSVTDLQGVWTHLEEFAVEDPRAEELVETTHNKIQNKYKKSIKRVVSTRTDTKKAPNKQFDLRWWQKTEKLYRENFYKAHKKFMVALRLYFEMLLEKDQDGTTYGLPEDHPERKEIVVRNRYVRIIDTVHQSIMVAKSGHHNQRGKSRLRKSDKVPFVQHTCQVTYALIANTIPYIIDKPEIQENLILMGTLPPTHDLKEDTYWTIPQIKIFQKRLADIYDSELMNWIRSGHLEEPVEFQRKVADLHSDAISRDHSQTLRMISNNTDLTIEEERRAIAEHIAGKGKTKDAIRSMRKKASSHAKSSRFVPKHKTEKERGVLSEKEIKSWNIKEEEAKTTKKTFRTFPKEYDKGKLTNFLVRYCTIAQEKPNRKKATATGKTKAEVLRTKIEDRCHNLRTMKHLPTEFALQNVRATTSRLIAWTMLDHNNKLYPMYRSIHELIETTLNLYYDLLKKAPELFTPEDFRHIEQLEQWKLELIPLEVHADVQKVYNEFEAAQAAA